MALKNTQNRFGSVTKTFHWLTALLILTAFPLGLIASNSDTGTEAGLTRAALLFSLHKTVGVSAFCVALLRILWALGNPKPGLLNAENRLEATLAEVVHWLLYGSMVIVPLSGWLHHAASEGFAPILWPLGQSLPLVPKSVAVSEFFAAWHFVFTKVLAVSVVLHVAGALKHHLIDRDATLRRMLPGTPELPADIARHPVRAPFLAALAIYAVAMAGGTVLGLQQHEAAHVDSAVLEEVESDWDVQSGRLAITVTQFGNQVTGEFKDWTADISFDPRTETGSVTVTVAIGSLDLGQVTQNALGVDYLNAAEFGTAVFEAQLARLETGLAATGTLTLRGVEMPLTLPFDLKVEGTVAQMTGSVRLNRLDFGVGTNQPTETNLGFAVDVAVALTAKQAG